MKNFFGQEQSALDLILDGTIGTFKVGKKEDTLSQSLEVKYFLTHVSLNPSSTAEEKLLNNLCPVREIFKFDELDFDELMQRDIDDTRVSLELIPYLLNDDNKGLIKLFPPIVVIVLPLEDLSKKPAKLYPNIDVKEEVLEDDKNIRVIERCGEIGKEVFQFEQIKVVKTGKKYKADGAKLSISTQDTALAIVDGQHRAMALLALYRNLKGGWDEASRQPYKHYYDVWPDAHIRKFKIEDIQLPIMLCTFPQLTDNSFDFDVVRAARRVFLTLNKNARKVSDSRNKLLDDQDMVSECLRETLSIIKNSNSRSQTSLRIFNVELDQDGDRQVISNAFAITGVSHLYYICERILFLADRIDGLTTKSSRLSTRKDPACVFHRLNLKNEFSQDEKNATRRDNYSDKIASSLKKNWGEGYGLLIIKLLSDIYPYKIHCEASLIIKTKLGQLVNEEALKTILFDGQGTIKILERFEDQIKEIIKNDPENWKTGEIEATKKTIGDLNNKKQEIINNLFTERAKLYFKNYKGEFKESLYEEGAITESVEVFVNYLIKDVCSTVAFQTALVYSLVDMAEDLELSIKDLIDEYIKSINNFFMPINIKSLKKLVRIMRGNIDSTSNKFNIVETKTAFRNIVHPGEMQPDEWPKYRYLILKVWKSKNEKIRLKIDLQIKKMEAEIQEKVIKREIEEFAAENSKSIEDLDDLEKTECTNKAKEQCEVFFSYFT